MIVPRGIILSGFCAVVFLAGCNKQSDEMPIPRDELPAVLLDIYVAEAEASILKSSVEQARVSALQKHGYDTTDLKESIRILTEDPEIGKDVYQSLLDSAIFEQREIRSRMTADSVMGLDN